MLVAVLFVFVLALLAPAVHRVARGSTGWLVATLPAGLFAYFAAQVERVAAGEALASQATWVPALGVSLAFRLDGLSLLFALIVTGVGALIAVYAGAYLHDDRRLGRFYALLLFFMASMLGTVLADDLILLFVFWELTSISSYFLIGFENGRPESRQAALQALLVTGGGGLALLAGFLLLGHAGGSYQLSVLLRAPQLASGSPIQLPVLLLVLAGAFTKSAQTPFHFWLPRAMEAPTPVSAYLHSATMVKAGIYLLARLAPILGDGDAWRMLVGGAGAATMLTGAVMAVFQRDLKRLLAYTTVSTLGTLTLLLGLGTTAAASAALALLLAHALYKGALFLVVGVLDHETGTRDVTRLGGLARAMPVTALVAALAGLSMAGLPPFFGFISKELSYAAGLAAPAPALLVTAAVLANAFVVAAAVLVGARPFLGPRRPELEPDHATPRGLLLGPALLAGLGLVLGARPAAVSDLIRAAVGDVRGERVVVELALWHGLNLALLLSGVTLAAGLALYRGHAVLARAFEPARALGAIGPERLYEAGLEGLRRLAAAQTRVLQSGQLRRYVLVVVTVTVVLASYALLTRGVASRPPLAQDLRVHEAALAALMLAGAAAVARLDSRLAAVAALGVVGFGVAMTFLSFGGPDLAITQFAIETLSVILFVLVLYRLPRFAQLSRPGERLRDALVALSAGALMTAFVWALVAAPRPSTLARYFAESSVPLGKGRNVVNVILVDFRGLDTLGEITVLALAGIGVHALVKLRPPEAEG